MEGDSNTNAVERGYQRIRNMRAEWDEKNASLIDNAAHVSRGRKLVWQSDLPVTLQLKAADLTKKIVVDGDSTNDPKEAARAAIAAIRDKHNV
jgi:flavin-binding protein dodecin